MSFDNQTLKTEHRFLTVSRSSEHHPRITFSGAWLLQWGINTDSLISFLSIKNGTLLMACDPFPHREEIPEYLQGKGIQQQLSLSAKGREPRTYWTAGTGSSPELIIKGAWLKDWGFSQGSRISLTHVGHGIILLESITPASQWHELLLKRKLERDASLALSKLRAHKSAHPTIYGSLPGINILMKTLKNPTAHR